MLLATDVPHFARLEKIEDLPGGDGGIPLERCKDEIFEAVRYHKVVLIDAATATGKSKVVPDVIYDALRAANPDHCRLLAVTPSTIDVVDMRRSTKVPVVSILVCVY
jgi:HrpA-like RNA helicase